MAGFPPRHASALRTAFDAKGGFWLNAGRMKIACLPRTYFEDIRGTSVEIEPLLVHCTEGVSRAGAVGAVLNEYFNRVIGDHEDDYRSFFLQNRRISPNPYVLRVMKETLGM